MVLDKLLHEEIFVLCVKSETPEHTVFSKASIKAQNNSFILPLCSGNLVLPVCLNHTDSLKATAQNTSMVEEEFFFQFSDTCTAFVHVIPHLLTRGYNID